MGLADIVRRAAVAAAGAWAVFARPFKRAEAATAPAAVTEQGARAVPSAAEFIAEWEGFSAVPYRCPAGYPTIGFGSRFYSGGVPVRMSDPPCTRAQALVWLTEDVRDAERVVAENVRVPLSPRARVACVSLAFNIGEGAFARSTLVRLLNEGRIAEAKAEIPKWNRAGGRTNTGLIKRRAAEAALFNGG